VHLLYISSSTAFVTCPTGIISTPSYDTTGAVFTVCAALNISAPAATVYNIVTDFAAYHEWNTFVTNVTSETGTFEVGTVMTFTDALLLPFGATTQTNEIVTALDAENTTGVWRYDSPAPLLIWAEHVSQITELDDGESAYVSWETYYGAGSVAAQLALGSKLKTAFAVQGQNLKAKAEA
jgi:hypothetical protein